MRKIMQSNQPYRDLANAIVESAVQDYREALKGYRRVIHRLAKEFKEMLADDGHGAEEIYKVGRNQKN